MPTFTVEAMDAKGKRIKTEIDVKSANDAIAQAKSKGYKPMNVKEKAGAAPSAPAATATPPPQPAPGTGRATAPPPVAPMPTGGKSSKKGLFLAGRVKHKQLTQFTQQ